MGFSSDGRKIWISGGSTLVFYKGLSLDCGWGVGNTANHRTNSENWCGRRGGFLMVPEVTSSVMAPDTVRILLKPSQITKRDAMRRLLLAILTLLACRPGFWPAARHHRCANPRCPSRRVCAAHQLCARSPDGDYAPRVSEPSAQGPRRGRAQPTGPSPWFPIRKA